MNGQTEVIKAMNNNVYKHRPLSSGRRTRVLELLPSKYFDADIICSLKETPIDRNDPAAIPYEALSYVWGSTVRDHHVFCDGLELQITANCHVALKYLRFKKRARVLWIDAICIHQEDVSERNHQVAIMGMIYRAARSVLVWLGEGNKQACRMLHTVKRFSSIASAMKTPLVPGRFNDHIEERVLDLYRWPSRDAIPTEWFTRIWTVQEAFLADDLHVLCGHTGISWKAFELWLSYQDRSPTPMEVILTFRTRESYREFLIAKKRTQRGCDIAVMNDILSRKLQSDAIDTIESCLNLAYERQTLEPLDRVYALHCILLDCGINLPLPDYHKSTATAFQEVIVAYLQLASSLLPIDDQPYNHDLHDWPSWLPNFERSSIGRPFRYPHEILAYPRFRHDFELQYQPGRLKLEGKLFDSIGTSRESLLEMKQKLLAARGEHISLPKTEPLRLTDEPKEQLERVVCIWLQDMFEMANSLSCPNGQSAKDAFMEALVYFDPFYCNVRGLDLVFDSNETWNKDSKGLVLQHLQTLMAEVCQRSDHDQHHDDIFRKQTTSKSKRTGQARYEDDAAQDNVWAAAKQIMDELSAPYSEGKPFLLSNGCVGVGKDVFQPGDHIAFLYGALIPAVLRATDEEGCYRLMGWAVVKGVPDRLWPLTGNEPEDEIQLLTLV